MSSSSTIPTTLSPSTTRTGPSASSTARAASRTIVSDGRAGAPSASPGLASRITQLQGEHVRLGDVGDEVPDVLVGRGADDLVGRADLDDLAVAHDQDPVAQLERLGEVVGDEHHRLADLLVQADDLVLHVAADQGVERGERLVEEQDVGVGGQRARQADALLHATGELVGVGALVAGQADQVDHLLRPVASCAAVVAADLEAEADVVEDLAVGQQAEVLEHHADPLAPQVAQGLLVGRT